jgi:hypothetical protein
MNGLQSVIINVIKFKFNSYKYLNLIKLTTIQSILQQLKRKLEFREVYIQIFAEIVFLKRNYIMNTMMSIIDGFHMKTGLSRELLQVLIILLLFI